jgi:hypothetical protein
MQSSKKPVDLVDYLNAYLNQSNFEEAPQQEDKNVGIRVPAAAPVPKTSVIASPLRKTQLNLSAASAKLTEPVKAGVYSEEDEGLIDACYGQTAKTGGKYTMQQVKDIFKKRKYTGYSDLTLKDNKLLNYCIDRGIISSRKREEAGAVRKANVSVAEAVEDPTAAKLLHAENALAEMAEELGRLAKQTTDMQEKFRLWEAKWTAIEQKGNLEALEALEAAATRIPVPVSVQQETRTPKFLSTQPPSLKLQGSVESPPRSVRFLQSGQDKDKPEHAAQTAFRKGDLSTAMNQNKQMTRQEEERQVAQSQQKSNVATIQRVQTTQRDMSQERQETERGQTQQKRDGGWFGGFGGFRGFGGFGGFGGNAEEEHEDKGKTVAATPVSNQSRKSTFIETGGGPQQGTPAAATEGEEDEEEFHDFEDDDEVAEREEKRRRAEAQLKDDSARLKQVLPGLAQQVDTTTDAVMRASLSSHPADHLDAKRQAEKLEDLVLQKVIERLRETPLANWERDIVDACEKNETQGWPQRLQAAEKAGKTLTREDNVSKFCDYTLRKWLLEKLPGGAAVTQSMGTIKQSVANSTGDTITLKGSVANLAQQVKDTQEVLEDPKSTSKEREQAMQDLNNKTGQVAPEKTKQALALAQALEAKEKEEPGWTNRLLRGCNGVDKKEQHGMARADMGKFFRSLSEEAWPTDKELIRNFLTEFNTGPKIERKIGATTFDVQRAGFCEAFGFDLNSIPDPPAQTWSQWWANTGVTGVAKGGFDVAKGGFDVAKGGLDVAKGLLTGVTGLTKQALTQVPSQSQKSTPVATPSTAKQLSTDQAAAAATVPGTPADAVKTVLKGSAQGKDSKEIEQDLQQQGVRPPDTIKATKLIQFAKENNNLELLQNTCIKGSAGPKFEKKDLVKFLLDFHNKYQKVFPKEPNDKKYKNTQKNFQRDSDKWKTITFENICDDWGFTEDFF